MIGGTLEATDAGRRPAVNDPQIWTLTGVLAASTFGMVGLTSTLFVRVVRAEIAALEAKMNARFERVDARFEVLDRDISAIARRVFPDEP